MNGETGQLFIVSAPSGAGKTSLLSALRARLPGIGVAVSHTTRAPRKGEVDGQHYHFVDDQTFVEMADDNAFLEHAQVFERRYGTSFAAAERVRREGLDLILEIDWQGALQVRKYTSDVIWILIAPPSLSELSLRLQKRETDSQAVIQKRLALAEQELMQACEADYLIVNDQFEVALQQLESVILAQRCRMPIRAPQGLKACLNWAV